MKIKNLEFKAVIFDLDGTLLNSCGIWSEVDKNFFSKRNLIMPDDYVESIAHIGLTKAAEYTKNRFNLPDKPEEIIAEWKNGVVENYRNVSLKPNSKAFIEHLLENNIPICAATANDEDCFKAALTAHGLYDKFLFIKKVNDYPFGKEDPAIYLDCAKELGFKPSEVVVFEDINQCILTASKAGFITVGVKEDSYAFEETKKQICDIYITDYSELN